MTGIGIPPKDEPSTLERATDVIGRLKYMEDVMHDKPGNAEWKDLAGDAIVAIRLLIKDGHRFAERAERNATMFQELHHIVDQWCDLQIAHPGCLPDAKALKERIGGGLLGQAEQG